MLHDGPARSHYLSIVDRRGPLAERAAVRKRQPQLGFLTFRRLYNQPYAMPPSFIDENAKD